MNKIQIIQYNCGEANHRLARPAIDAAAQQAPSTIFALQEQHVQEGSHWTYAPRTHYPIQHPT